MIGVGHYSIPPSISYNGKTPEDYVNNPLPTKINLVNLPDVISAVGTRIKEGQTIGPIVFEGIGEAINTARPEHGGLPLATFGDCYGEKIEQITKLFVPYVKNRVSFLRNYMGGGTGDNGVTIEEVAKLLLIAKIYFPELNGRLHKAHQLVDGHITILENNPKDNQLIF